MQQNKLAQSKILLENALSVLEKNVDANRLMECHDLLSQLYEKQGRYELAHKNLTLYNHLKDSLFNLEREEEIQKLEIQYQVDKKTTENELLRAEKEIADETVKSRTAIALGTAAILLLLAGWSYFIYKNNKQRKAYNEILEKK